MSDTWLVFAVMIVLLASSALGVFLQGILKERHRSRDTIDAVRLVISSWSHSPRSCSASSRLR